jgi:hypothetical protein
MHGPRIGRRLAVDNDDGELGRRVHFLRVVCVRSEVVDEVLDLCKEAEKSTTAFLCPPLQVEQCFMLKGSSSRSYK